MSVSDYKKHAAASPREPSAPKLEHLDFLPKPSHLESQLRHPSYFVRPGHWEICFDASPSCSVQVMQHLGKLSSTLKSLSDKLEAAELRRSQTKSSAASSPNPPSPAAAPYSSVRPRWRKHHPHAANRTPPSSPARVEPLCAPLCAVNIPHRLVSSERKNSGLNCKRHKAIGPIFTGASLPHTQPVYPFHTGAPSRITASQRCRTQRNTLPHACGKRANPHSRIPRRKASQRNITTGQHKLWVGVL